MCLQKYTDTSRAMRAELEGSCQEINFRRQLLSFFKRNVEPSRERTHHTMGEEPKQKRCISGVGHQLEEAYDNKKTTFSETRDLAHTLIPCLGRKPLLLTLVALLLRNVGASGISSSGENGNVPPPRLRLKRTKSEHEQRFDKILASPRSPGVEDEKEATEIPASILYKNDKYCEENGDIPDYGLVKDAGGNEVKLGAGNYGTVFKAVFTDIHGNEHEAALKVCIIPTGEKEKEKIRKDLENEVNVHKALGDTKHCLNLYASWRQNLKDFVDKKLEKDVGEVESNEECQMFLLPLCNGGSLYNFINKNGMFKLNEIEYWTYAKQVVEGYQEMHKRNVLYKDGNIFNFFVHDGKIKLADFGLSLPNFSKYTEDNMPGLDAMGQQKFAPEWYTPKQNGKFQYALNSDIWSIGFFLDQMSRSLQSKLRYKVGKTRGRSDLWERILSLSTKCRNEIPEKRLSLDKILEEIKKNLPSENDSEGCTDEAATAPRNKPRKKRAKKNRYKPKTGDFIRITKSSKGNKDKTGTVERHLPKSDKWGIKLDSGKKVACFASNFVLLERNRRRLGSIAKKLERFEQMF